MHSVEIGVSFLPTFCDVSTHAFRILGFRGTAVSSRTAIRPITASPFLPSAPVRCIPWGSLFTRQDCERGLIEFESRGVARGVLQFQGIVAQSSGESCDGCAAADATACALLDAADKHEGAPTFECVGSACERPSSVTGIGTRLQSTVAST
jgi:hypothetical protein